MMTTAETLWLRSGPVRHPVAAGIIRRWQGRVADLAGQRGVTAARARLDAAAARWVEAQAPTTRTTLERGAEGIARMAQALHDEHGSRRGDHLHTRPLDYVAPAAARPAPYCDQGGAGLALIEILRRRVYARSAKWFPSEAATRFLCGRNEAGTWFAHAVPLSCGTALEAVQWIWGGRAAQIVQRQGDIALVACPGPRMPTLPPGHRVVGGQIVHATHPPLPLPGPGQRIIVARRAVVRASAETRD